MNADKPPENLGLMPRRGWLRVAAWCALGMLFSNTFGILLNPQMPVSSDLDASWIYSMNQAAAQRMAFGRDIIFTFGPYASIYTHAYHPGTVWMMLLGSLLLDGLFACCFAWLVRRAAWSRATIIAALLFAPMVALDNWFCSFILLEAVFVFSLLDGKPSESEKPMNTLLAAAFFGAAGMLPLIKVSYMVLQACFSALCLIFLLFHRRWMMAIVCSIAPPIGMFVFWIAAGQHTANLPDFISSSTQMISGYSQAMSGTGRFWEAPLFFTGALAVLIAIVLARRLSHRLKLFLLLAYALYFFFSFKEGFVRQDDHVYIAFLALAPAALFLMLLQTPQRKRFSPVLCSISLLVAMGAFETLWPEFFTSVVEAQNLPVGTFHGLKTLARFSRLRAVLGDRKVLIMVFTTEPHIWFVRQWTFTLRPWRERFEDARRDINASTYLNFDLQGTVDDYFYEQAAVLARGYDWDPRPVFLSYSAYTPQLIRDNEQHLRGTAAPDHILFQLETIDNRLPALDDGLSWPAMLDNYRVAGVSGEWVHLERIPDPIRKESQFKLLARLSAQLGQQVAMPAATGPVFAQIALSPSFYGRLLGTIYKLPAVELTLNCRDGQSRRYRVIPNMMHTGFFLSPLVIDNNGLVRLFDPSKALTDETKVRSLSLDSDGRGWSGSYTITFRQYEYGSP